MNFQNQPEWLFVSRSDSPRRSRGFQSTGMVSVFVARRVASPDGPGGFNPIHSSAGHIMRMPRVFPLTPGLKSPGPSIDATRRRNFICTFYSGLKSTAKRRTVATRQNGSFGSAISIVLLGFQTEVWGKAREETPVKPDHVASEKTSPKGSAHRIQTLTRPNVIGWSEGVTFPYIPCFLCAGKAC